MQDSRIEHHHSPLLSLESYIADKKLKSDSIIDKVYVFVAKFFGNIIEINNSNKIIFVYKSDLKGFLVNQIKETHKCLSPQEIEKIVNNILNQKISKNNILQFNKIDNIKDATINYLKLGLIYNITKNFKNDETASEKLRMLEDFLVEGPTSNNMYDLRQDFIEFIQTNSGTKKGEAAIRLLSEIHKTKEDLPELKSFGKEVSQTLLKISAIAFSEIKPSKEETFVPRTPTEILFDLLAYLEARPLDTHKEIEKEVRSLFLSHQMTISQTREFLKKIQDNYPGTEIADKCQTLEKQLMTNTIHTRLHDNIYGRAFDTAFVTELVDNPPQEVCQAMTQMSHNFADYLEQVKQKADEKTASEISKKISKLLNDKNPRFWFPAIQEVEELRYSNKDVFSELIAYLREPKNTGPQCISIPYFIAKVSLILDKAIFPPPWLISSDVIYSVRVTAQIEHIRLSKEGTPMKTEGAGITLHYQPSIANESWMEPSERPTTVRRPDFNSQEAISSAKESLDKSLQHGLPWASGMSGSTSINMHAWQYFNQQNPNNPIDPKATFLGVLMFLVYDGGHSIHEPLWTASQINKRCQLGFNLAKDDDDIQDFIADYQRFTNMYQGPLKDQIAQAFSKAFDKVVDYFNQHSIHAKK